MKIVHLNRSSFNDGALNLNLTNHKVTLEKLEARKEPRAYKA